MTDISEQLRMDVEAAFNDSHPLRIAAGHTKAFLGEACSADTILDVTNHRGIINYQPGELIVTVRAGTPLSELQNALAEKGQMLTFEPPHFGIDATIGGAIAAGLSGPSRAYVGAARDFVLGCRIINGRGQILQFGGEVMKNVAGYDLSRLMAGAWGTLGVLLDVSLKVLPQPRAQATVVHECDAAEAISQFNRWAGKPLPITATWWESGRSYTRLAGAQPAVEAARRALGGSILNDNVTFWTDVREQRRAFFDGNTPLWRLSLAPATASLDIEMEVAIEWGGAQRWIRSKQNAATIRSAVAAVGGHASIWRGDATPRFHPLQDGMMALQRRIKHSLDPAGILNPGRMYSQL